MNLEYKLEGLEKLAKRAEGMYDRVENPSVVLSVCASKGWKDVMDHFKQEQGPTGKWEASGRVEDEGGKTLQDRGYLRNSISFRVLKDEAHIYTGDKRARLLNFGGEFTAFGKYEAWMPERKFMWLSKECISNIINFFAKYIVKGDTSGS